MASCKCQNSETRKSYRDRLRMKSPETSPEACLETILHETGTGFRMGLVGGLRLPLPEGPLPLPQWRPSRRRMPGRPPQRAARGWQVRRLVRALRHLCMRFALRSPDWRPLQLACRHRCRQRAALPAPRPWRLRMVRRAWRCNGCAPPGRLHLGLQIRCRLGG